MYSYSCSITLFLPRRLLHHAGPGNTRLYYGCLSVSSQTSKRANAHYYGMGYVLIFIHKLVIYFVPISNIYSCFVYDIICNNKQYAVNCNILVAYLFTYA